MRVGIVGLGLMGGSLALSLKALNFIKEIVGFDHNKAHEETALARQLVSQCVDMPAIEQCDVIFLAIPVDAIKALLQTFTCRNEDCTIIDLGSTKEAIVHAVPPAIRKNFVAAHPMTGTEFFGPEAAIEGLYKDHVVVLCNLEESGKQQQENAVRIFSGIHMRLIYMRAHEHDRHAAFISHLPHAISYSLANTVMKQEDRYAILAMAAGGFRSMSRLAKSSPKMWEDIFRQNSDNLLESIELFERELKMLKQNILNNEFKAVAASMHDANKLHDIL